MIAGLAGRRIDDTLYLTFMTFLAPPAVLAVDMADGSVRTWGRERSPWDPDDFVSEQVFVTSEDGTRVPLFLSRRRDVEPDGNVRTLLYGYGGFQIPTGPTFKPEWLAWMERGGLLAVASLRGRRRVRQGLARRGPSCEQAERVRRLRRLCPLAGRIGVDARRSGSRSAGARTAACWSGRASRSTRSCSAPRSPEVGVMDMLRFHQFTIGWGWTSDYGSPDDPDDFRTLFAYSPLHNCRPGCVYPPTLVTTGDHDDRVVPGHSFKFAAALQAAQAGDGADPDPRRHRRRARHGQAGHEADRRAQPTCSHSSSSRSVEGCRPGSLRLARCRRAPRHRASGSRRRPGAGPRRGGVRQSGRPRRHLPAPEFVRLLFGVRAPEEPAHSGSTWPASSNSVGPAVTRFTPGDRVFADLLPVRPGRVRRVRRRARSGHSC